MLRLCWRSFAKLDTIATYDAANVYLTLIRNDIAFTDIGSTATQSATGTGVTGLGGGSNIYQAVVLADVASAPLALDLLSGEVHATSKTLLAQDSPLALGAAFQHTAAPGIHTWGEVAE